MIDSKLSGFTPRAADHLPHDVGEDGWGPVRKLALGGNVAMAQPALAHRAGGTTPTLILPHFVGEEAF
jgi:hypothetical protein